MNKKIAVIMSVYNGATYLKEQIDSIVSQKDIDVTLFIRNDGSKDDSKHILMQYRDFQNVIILDDERNMGYKNSFLEGLKYALHYDKFEFFSFADQDDVWLPNKLVEGVNHLESTDDNEYKLYFSSLQFVDKDLNYLELKDYDNLDLGLAPSLVRFSLSGATFIFNRNLAEMTMNHGNFKEFPDGHDALIYRLNVALGGKTVYDHNSYILYRRHENNVSLGGKDVLSKLLKEFSKKFYKLNTRSAKYVLNSYDNFITPDGKEILNVFTHTGMIATLKLLSDKRFRREDSLMNIIFFIKVITKRI